MHQKLRADRANYRQILDSATAHATKFMDEIDSRAVAMPPTLAASARLPEEGLGAVAAMGAFNARFGPHLSVSPGPRYFGFVTGGSTPAAICGDWLASVYDQNATGFGDSCAPIVELETISMLRDLLGLPSAFTGSFVSGATMSNFTGLAIARQWLGQQIGVDVAAQGIAAIAGVKVFAATPHSSTMKALAMLGMGRSCMRRIPCLHEREAMDMDALGDELRSRAAASSIVIASAGTVNTADFDDLQALVELRAKYGFWLHVDGAFGAFAACSPKYAHLVDGIQHADSIAVDCHKWLNVPYDSALQFSRHQTLQLQVFQNDAAYLSTPTMEEPNFVHFTPENSRRFRALPAWMTLNAYGKRGYREIVERSCALAQALTRWLSKSSRFKVLAPTRLNVVCFALIVDGRMASMEQTTDYLNRVRDDGKVFLTPTLHQGTAAIRAAMCNWRSETEDVTITIDALCRSL